MQNMPDRNGGPPRRFRLGWGLCVPLIVVAAAAGCGRAPDVSGGSEPTAGGARPVAVTEQTFAAEVEEVEGVVVVDFWAPWCGPCKIIAPALEKLAGEFEGRVKICKVNVDDNQSLARRFKIDGIPAVVLFKDGEAKDMKVGSHRERDYRQWFEAHL